MKTLCKETKNGTTATATEFQELCSAIRFMKEKKSKKIIVPQIFTIRETTKSRGESPDLCGEFTVKSYNLL